MNKRSRFIIKVTLFLIFFGIGIGYVALILRGA